MAEHKLSYTASEIDNRLRRVDNIPVVDSELSTTSTNPVQNKVITSKINSIESSLNQKANTSAIPTKTSQLTNNSGFLTSIPSEYVTETELTNKGYATQASVTALSNRIDNLPTGGNITVDSALSSTSTNPVQNKVIYEEFSKLEEALVKDFSDINDGFNEVFGEIEAIHNEIDNLSASGGKTLIGEITLDSSNLTTTDTAGIYALGTDVQAVMQSVCAKLDEGFGGLIAELTIADLTTVLQCNYLSGSEALNAFRGVCCVSSSRAHASELTQYDFLESYFRTNQTDAANAMISGAMTCNVKFYTISGGAGSGGSGGEPYYKKTVTLFDEDVEITNLGDGLLGANITFDLSKMPDNGTEEFEVAVDNVLYPCEIKMLMGLLPYLGNERIVDALTGGTGECEDTGEPFAIIINSSSSDGEAIIAMEELGTYHFKVDNVIGAKKLDSSLIDWTNGGMPSGLPEVTEEDNDKVLVVVNGKWAVASIANGDEVAY